MYNYQTLVSSLKDVNTIKTIDKKFNLNCEGF